MSIDWFQHLRDVEVQFGHDQKKTHPSTLGMNEKAGMNSEELDKCIRNSILPLFPDTEDVPGKRVTIKIDSGPGRTNIGMLAHARLLGLCFAPGVPSATGKTQETDQNCGPFKTYFRTDLRILSQACFDKGLNMSIADLPLLVFGGVCSRTQCELVPALDRAFGIDENLKVWKKCGAVPLTRAPVFTAGVRSEVPVGPAAERNDVSFVDPEVELLKKLDQHNKICCDFLSANGCDGSHLRKEAPTRRKFVAVTKPQTAERIQQLKDAKTHGQLLHATGGQHLNSDDCFRAQTLKDRKKQIEGVEDRKKNRTELLRKQKAATDLIKKRGDPAWRNQSRWDKDQVMVMCRWKDCAEGLTRKNDLVDAHISTTKPKPVAIWKRAEEAELKRLKKETMPLKETALGVATHQMARAVTQNVAQPDEESKEKLRAALDECNGDVEASAEQS